MSLRSHPLKAAGVSMPRTLMQLGAVAEKDSSARGPPPVAVFGTIYVGTPAQELSVAFDTGSGNVLLPSSRCTSVSCLSHRSYDPAMSATAGQVNASRNRGVTPTDVRLSVGTGSVAGSARQDKVCLGAEENLCGMTGLVEATRMSDEPFSLFPFDGILGLGLPATSLGRDFNLLETLAENDALESNRFAVWLSAEGDGEDSEITFGAISDARMGSHDILWQPLSRTDTGLWQARMKDVAIDGLKMHLCGEEGCQAAFDTGTGVIAGPTTLIKALLAVLNINTDCTNYNSLPMLGFAFGRAVFNIDPADYVRKTDVGCFHQFLAVDIPPPRGPIVLLGTPFLRRYYTIYDSASLRIGVAFAKHKTSSREGETNAQAAERLMVQQQSVGEGLEGFSGLISLGARHAAPAEASATSGGPETWVGWALHMLGDDAWDDD